MRMSQEQRAAAHALKVFVSGTQDDLQPEREAVDTAIKGLRLLPVRAETMGSQSRPSRDAILKAVAECDIYLGVYGGRYGWLVPDAGVSATELEYNEAQRLGKPTLIFVKAVDDLEQKQAEFLRRVQDFNTGYFRRPKFTAVAELAGGVQEDLAVLVSELVRNSSPVQQRRASRYAIELMKACQQQVAGAVRTLAYKYDRGLYVHREEIERGLNEFFDRPLAPNEPNCYLIVAPAGSGKTTLLCELATERVMQQPVVLLMGGSTFLTGTMPLIGTIQSELQASNSDLRFESLEQCLHTLHWIGEGTGKDTLVLLDAINEADQPAAMRKAVENLLRVTRGLHVKVVITCRDHYWNLYKGQFWRGATINELPTESVDVEVTDGVGDYLYRFSAKEGERALELYLKHYGIIGRPVGNAVEQCRHPLLLLFFCEAYRGQDVSEVSSIRLKELFDRYWERKLESIAERVVQQGAWTVQPALAENVADYLLKLAAYMLQQAIRAIPVHKLPIATGRTEVWSDLRSMYGRIRDEYIILEDKGRGTSRYAVEQVGFVYEEFMEYVMARSLMRDWSMRQLSNSAIPAEIEHLRRRHRAFATILGVMVYLALMLKHERKVALWPMLMGKGKEWREVVLETIRKLPEDELDESVFDALDQMLATMNGYALARVLDTLKIRRIGAAAANGVIRKVIKLAECEAVGLRLRAVLALGYMKSELTLPVIIGALDDQYRNIRGNAVRALARQGRAGVPILITCLRHRDDYVRSVAIDQLRGLGDMGFQALLELLDSEDAEWQSAGVEALGDLGDLRAVDPLLELVRLPDASGRSEAVESLAKLKDPRAVESLIDALRDPNERIRVKIAWALGELRDTRATQVLVDTLEQSEPVVRVAAAKALGKSGDPTALRALLACLHEPDVMVWTTAAVALWKLGEQQGVEELLATLRRPANRVTPSALTEAEKKLRASTSRTILITWSPGQNGPLLLGTVFSTDDQQSADMREIIRQVVESETWNAAVKGLSEIDEPRVVEALIQALVEDLRAYEVTWPLKQLHKRGKVEVVGPLVSRLTHEASQVRVTIAELLGELRDRRAVEPLIVALRDSDPVVRAAAARSLGRLKDQRALEPVIEAFDDADPRVRAGAAEALGWLRGERALELLIAALHDPDSHVLGEVGHALTRFNNERAVNALREAEHGAWYEAFFRWRPEPVRDEDAAENDSIFIEELESEEVKE